MDKFAPSLFLSQSYGDAWQDYIRMLTPEFCLLGLCHFNRIQRKASGGFS